MVKFNCLAKDLKNAMEIYKITDENTLVGLSTKSFKNDEEAIKTMSKWAKKINNNISIGLGEGDPKQAYMVTRIAKKVFVNHINQVFTEVPATRKVSLNKNAIINSLISPSGIPGQVIISTGPESSFEKPVIGNIMTVGKMIIEMGANAVKFFNMKNMKSDKELVKVAKMCAKYDLILEMTGGLSLNNIEKYVKIAKDANVKKIIPHIYSSIIDKKTGLTKKEDVKKIWKILKRYY